MSTDSTAGGLPALLGGLWNQLRTNPVNWALTGLAVYSREQKYFNTPGPE
jgi:hypothetical protein